MEPSDPFGEFGATGGCSKLFIEAVCRTDFSFAMAVRRKQRKFLRGLIAAPSYFIVPRQNFGCWRFQLHSGPSRDYSTSRYVHPSRSARRVRSRERRAPMSSGRSYLGAFRSMGGDKFVRASANPELLDLDCIPSLREDHRP